MSKRGNARHTPGPWHVSNPDVQGERAIVGANPHSNLNPVVVWLGIGESACSDADASLIAAAPKLLEAARGAVAMLQESAKQHRAAGDMGHARLSAEHADRLRAAIAQARGEDS